MNQILIALFVGMNIVFGTVFLSVGGFFLYAGLTNQPVWMRKYKIQKGTNEPVWFVNK